MSRIANVAPALGDESTISLVWTSLTLAPLGSCCGGLLSSGVQEGLSPLLSISRGPDEVGWRSLVDTCRCCRVAGWGC
eukprot:scaffold59035_cov63-Phaeocystis_antarctica.AAC.10